MSKINWGLIMKLFSFIFVIIVVVICIGIAKDLKLPECRQTTGWILSSSKVVDGQLNCFYEKESK